MEGAFIRPAVAADAGAVTEIVVALESSLYGPSTFSQADLEAEWSDVDLGRDAVVVDDGRRLLGYGLLRERDDLWRAEGYVHPDAARRYETLADLSVYTVRVAGVVGQCR